MKRKNNKNLIVVLLLCLITIGFAALSTTLSINGTTKIKGNTWDIHFENVRFADSNNVDADLPVINPSDPTKVDFDVTLSKPGDVFSFYVDIKNDGSVDAKLGDLNVTGFDALNDYPYMFHDVFYTLGEEKNDFLKEFTFKAGDVRTVFFTVGYDKTVVSNGNLASDNINLDFSLTTDVTQADGTLKKSSDVFFVCEDAVCTADTNMTFGEWINSEYNTVGYYITENCSGEGNCSYSLLKPGSTAGLPLGYLDSSTYYPSYYEYVINDNFYFGYID